MVNYQPSTPALHSIEAGVYWALREEIVALRLLPGERLMLEEVASRYGISHTPVRQAFRRLESDGLVVTRGNRGSCVAPLTADELEEIQAIRIGVEGLLARAGAESCTTGALVEMEVRLADVQAAYTAGDLDAYVRAQRLLKDVCYTCANRPRLLRVLDTQRVRAERYIRYLCRNASALATTLDQQVAFLEACRARDGVAAEATIREALELTLARLRTMLEATDFDDASSGS